MAAQRERFADAVRPIIPEPVAVAPAVFQRDEWERRKHEVRIWQRRRLRELRGEIEDHALVRAGEAFAEARRRHDEQQAEADAWWRALNEGESSVLTAALKSAFAENPVGVVEASGSEAVVTITLPSSEVLPRKKAHVTPTGRLSSKVWTKTELNDVYAELLGAHLLATVRESWAVAPSLTNLRLVGGRQEGDGSIGILFDVEVSRSDGQWDNDEWGSYVLRHAQWGLKRTGKAEEVQVWPQDRLRPDVWH